MEQVNPAYVLSGNIITSLGFTTAANCNAILNNTTGICRVDDPELYPSPFMLSRPDESLIDKAFQEVAARYGSDHHVESFTRLERMFIISIDATIRDQSVDPRDPGTILIISSTKGNINLLEEKYKMRFNHKRIYLWEMARMVRQFFGFYNKPVIISHACISGLLAIIAGMRYLKQGQYRHAVVSGGDIISEFVISGFHSFQALSSEPCKPFDLHRNGLSLGEGCGTMLLSRDKPNQSFLIKVCGGATSNDANHISGPSRTGEELSLAINNAMKEADITSAGIDYICAHGTATPFNDEMESKALELSSLQTVPLNSLKGYWGHTLGAAGIIESVAAVESLRTDTLFSSAGFEIPGVPSPVNVIKSHEIKPLRNCLKTASGFGGCNAAAVFKKVLNTED